MWKYCDCQSTHTYSSAATLWLKKLLQEGKYNYIHRSYEALFSVSSLVGEATDVYERATEDLLLCDLSPGGCGVCHLVTLRSD